MFTNRIALATLIVAIATTPSLLRADLIIGGSFPGGSDMYPTIRRYSDSGTYLGQIGKVQDEDIDVLTTDSLGNVFAVANTLGGNTIYRFTPGGTMTKGYDIVTISQGFTVAWNDRLFVTSNHSDYFSQSLTGVLELSPTSLKVSQNVIPFASTTTLHGLAFDPAKTYSGSYRAGALYVGTSYSTTLRYRMSTSGTIAKDTSFSIPAYGQIQFRDADSNIYIKQRINIGTSYVDAIVAYDSTTGTSLGSILSRPSDTIVSFDFAPDNSIYVFTRATSYTLFRDYTLYHYDPSGALLGPVLTVQNMHASFAYATPEPTSLALLTLSASTLLIRSRRPRRPTSNSAI